MQPDDWDDEKEYIFDPNAGKPEVLPLLLIWSINVVCKLPLLLIWIVNVVCKSLQLGRLLLLV